MQTHAGAVEERYMVGHLNRSLMAEQFSFLFLVLYNMEILAHTYFPSAYDL